MYALRQLVGQTTVGHGRMHLLTIITTTKYTSFTIHMSRSTFCPALARIAKPFRLSLLGVPEQVNIPIKICLEQNIFAKYGVDVKYTSVREGTGQMLKMLDAGAADLAITVTDGFISGQASGSNVALVGTYVQSPLVWTVCAHPNSKLTCIDDFFTQRGNKTIGISRLKSGSHTMSYYMNFLYNKSTKFSSSGKSNNNCDRSGQHCKQTKDKGLRFQVLGGLEELKRGASSPYVHMLTYVHVFQETKLFYN